MKSPYIKFALPKGRFSSSTARLLSEIDLGFSGYSGKTRQYRLDSAKLPHLSAKIFQEKDIPIQVAIGNYDLGICGSDWVEELLAKYPTSKLVKISSLNYGEGSLYAVVSYQGEDPNFGELAGRQGRVHIVSEYPNLAEAFALNLRIRKFRVFPVWGSSYEKTTRFSKIPILWGENENKLESQGLVPLAELLPVNAFLIANQQSLENKDLSWVLSRLSYGFTGKQHVFMSNSPNKLALGKASGSKVKDFSSYWETKEIKLALPDGHQQLPTAKFLKRAEFNFQGYSEEVLSPRPLANLDWMVIKVIRPQDMPLQVANGNFDLAITGEDWLLDHLYRFPSSPAMKLLNLGFGKVKIVAAVSSDMPIANIGELRLLIQSGKLAPLRVASEYINIADKYLRDNHISPYKLIPTYGASEAFLPEDADLLIDNVQTGETIKRHNLKTIGILFESTACVIGNKDSLNLQDKRGEIDFITRRLQAGLS